MQVDCDYYSKAVNGGIESNADDCKFVGSFFIAIEIDFRTEEKAVIRLFGVNASGNSVAAYIHNFTAYFYIQVCNNC